MFCMMDQGADTRDCIFPRNMDRVELQRSRDSQDIGHGRRPQRRLSLKDDVFPPWCAILTIEQQGKDGVASEEEVAVILILNPALGKRSRVTTGVIGSKGTWRPRLVHVVGA